MMKAQESLVLDTHRAALVGGSRMCVDVPCSGYNDIVVHGSWDTGALGHGEAIGWTLESQIADGAPFLSVAHEIESEFSIDLPPPSAFYARGNINARIRRLSAHAIRIVFMKHNSDGLSDDTLRVWVRLSNQEETT